MATTSAPKNYFANRFASLLWKIGFAAFCCLLLTRIGINVYQRYLRTTLFAAVEAGNTARLRMVLARGVDPNTYRETSSHSTQTPLQIAIQGKHTEAIRMLLQAGADPKRLHDAADMLQTAVINGDVAEVQALFQVGISPNAVGRSGETALTTAVMQDNVSMLTFLLDNGADVNTRSQYGLLALSLAISLNHPLTARLLLARGADINAHDHSRSRLPSIGKPGVTVQSDTPLTWAVMSRNREMLHFLLAHRVQVNAQTVNGDTALHLACYIRNKEFIEQLLIHGANPNISNKAGQTALTLAERAKRPDIIALLNAAARKTGHKLRNP